MRCTGRSTAFHLRRAEAARVRSGRHAAGGEGAGVAAWLTGTKPALILLDLLMPAKDGWEVVASMKAVPRLRDVPIVVMSAIPPRATTLQAQGIAGTLTKPFTVEEMMFVVTRFVKLRAGK